MNIHLKIEAKKHLQKVGLNLLFLREHSPINNLYRGFNRDAFLLPYKVIKISKRMRKSETVSF